MKLKISVQPTILSGQTSLPKRKIKISSKKAENPNSSKQYENINIT
jgi:hypothetical protein